MLSLIRALTVSAALAALAAEAPAAVLNPAPASAFRNAFGAAVVVGDGEVFVAESGNQFRNNMVYIYRKGAAGWTQAAKLTAPDPEIGTPFGNALALDGNTLFVGGGPARVYVFRKSAGTWAYASTIETSTAGAVGIDFGSAITASGDWLMIGKQPSQAGRAGGAGGAGQAAPAQPSGAVYVFRRDGSGRYSYSSTLTGTADASVRAGDMFGSSVAITGNTALIGAPGQSANAGVVHEMTLENGEWKAKRTFAPTGATTNDRFGSAISVNGTQAMISALGDGGNYGAVYLYRRQPPGAGRAGAAPSAATPGAPVDSTWAEIGRLASPAGARNDGFGASTSISDRDAIVGAPRANRDGGVFLYARDTIGVKVNASFLTPGNLQNGGAVGQSVSVRGNIAAVGASGVERGAGAVVIYERGATGAWVKQPMLRTPLDELVAMTGKENKCDEKGTVGKFECGNSSLMSFLPPSKLTFDGHYIPMNDIWGWTDPVTKKEWALVGRRDGTTFVDMSDLSNPIAVADLPMTPGAQAAAWRDIKTYKDYAYIVADNSLRHGMQVFDLRRLRAMKPVNGRPVKIQYDTVYREINSAHNIVINEESGYAYSVGSSGGGTTCGGGLHMIDIREPGNPKFAGCFAHTGTGRTGTGYSHDAQCVTYKGPDKRYTGHEICIGSNETAISIADVTDKKAPKALSQATYPNVAYAHQGWFDENHKYFYLDDESDELQFAAAVPTTRTMIWDLSDLENPRLAKQYLGVSASSDHNQYVLGKQVYQANYGSGLRILDINDPENPKEVSFFDTAPGKTTPGYTGAWSVFPYFKSGAVLVNSIEQGLFIVKQAPRVVF